MKNQYTCLLFLCFGLAISSCRCKDDDKPCTDPSNPKCENYDPCHDKKPTAEFTMSQWWGWNNTEFSEKAEDCDTIKTPSVLLMSRSNIVGAHYTWQIGTDTREFNNKEFNLSFNEWRQDSSNWDSNDPNISKPIPISLTVRYDKGECIKDKDTILKYKRNLVFVKGKYSTIPFGTFRGKTNEDDQERVVEIAWNINENVPLSYQSRLFLINFPNLENKDSLVLIGSDPFQPMKLQSYKYYWWDQGHDNYIESNSTYVNGAQNDGINMGKFIINHQPPHDLYIEFEYKHVAKDGRVKTYHFKGNKIN